MGNTLHFAYSDKLADAKERASYAREKQVLRYAQDDKFFVCRGWL
jgi:hypothetical protein